MENLSNLELLTDWIIMRIANVLYVYNYKERKLEIYTNLRIDKIETCSSAINQRDYRWYAMDANTRKRFEIDYSQNKVFESGFDVYTLWMDQHDKRTAYVLFKEYFTKNLELDISNLEKNLKRYKQKLIDIVDDDLPKYFGEK